MTNRIFPTVCYYYYYVIQKQKKPCQLVGKNDAQYSAKVEAKNTVKLEGMATN